MVQVELANGLMKASMAQVPCRGARATFLLRGRGLCAEHAKSTASWRIRINLDHKFAECIGTQPIRTQEDGATTECRLRTLLMDEVCDSLVRSGFIWQAYVSSDRLRCPSPSWHQVKGASDRWEEQQDLCSLEAKHFSRQAAGGRFGYR